MKINYLDNKLSYYYNQHYHILPCLGIEYNRIKLLQELNAIIRTKYPSFKKSIFEILLQKTNKKYDPILAYVSNEDTGNKDITNLINTNMKSIIKKIRGMKYVNEKVKKSISSEIILEYRDIRIEIKRRIYNRIRKSIIDSSFEFFCNYDTLLWMIYNRYIKMELYNNSQGATKEEHYREIQQRFNSQIEGFGSIFNHTLPYYFGLFPDLEQYFGCLGNFYISHIKSGFYLVNPPFTVNDINRTIRHILKQLELSKHDLTFLLVIPAWDNEDRVLLNKKCKTKLKITKYEEELELWRCRNSKYLRKYYLYCKEDYKYYNFLLDKDAYFTATNLILLSNTRKEYNIQSIFGKPIK